MSGKYYLNSQFPQIISWTAKSPFFPIRIKRLTKWIAKSKKDLTNTWWSLYYKEISESIFAFINSVSHTRFVTYTDGRTHCSNEWPIL